MKFAIAALAFLCVATSVNAGVRHGVASSGGGVVTPPTGTYANACGTTPVGQNWCVGTDGWTVFTPLAGSGTCGNSTSNFTGTCIVAADSVGGNDTTCAAQTAASGSIATSNDLPSFAPTLPCQSVAKAQTLTRNNKPDWIALKKGSSWVGGINGPTSGALVNKSGQDINNPMLFIAYGSGARPSFVRTQTGSNTGCVDMTAANGGFLGIVGIMCDTAALDPDQPSQNLFATITADTGASNCGAANIICHISPPLPAWVTAGSNHFSVSASNIPYYFINAVNVGCPGSGDCLTMSGNVGAVVNGVGIASNITASTATNQLTVTVGPPLTVGMTITGTGIAANTTIVSGTSSPYTLSTTPGTLGSRAMVALFADEIGVTVQIAPVLNGWTANGIGSSGITNFQYWEDNKVNRGVINLGGGCSIQCTLTTTWIARRNVDIGMIAGGFGAAASYYNTATNTGQILWEENVGDSGGWTSEIWAWSGNNQSHSMYLHDPGLAHNLTRNLIAHGSGTGVQWRTGGTATGNLWLDQATSVSAAVNTNTTSVSYDVFANGRDFIVGERPALGARTSGNIIDVTGFTANTNISLVSGTIMLKNMTNPGSLVQATQVVGATNTKQITISSSIQPGTRGDGIQPGDKLRFMNPRGQAIIATRVGLAESAGANNNFYAGPSTLTTVTAGTPSVVTDVSKRPNDELFQFTSGTLPTGALTSHWYCTMGTTGLTYNFYEPDAGTGMCLGGGTAINTTGSGGASIPRTGSRNFFFNTPNTSFSVNWPVQPVWPWVSVGNNVYITEAGNAWAVPAPPNNLNNGATTVAYISPDRQTLVVTDPTLVAINGIDQSHMMWGIPSNPNYPRGDFGLNNLFLDAKEWAANTAGAMSWSSLANDLTFAGSYIYNWDNVSTANNIQYAPNNATGGAAFSSTLTVTPALNVVNSTLYPRAHIEAYDAFVVGNGSFTGSITAGGTGCTGGSILTVPTGTGPTIGDTVFEAALPGSGVAQYTEVVSQIDSTHWCTTNSQTVTSRAMTSGSWRHLVNLAKNQSKETGWLPQLNPAAIGNYLRAAVACGVSDANHPSPPACPAQ